jgi:hypothetical protein
MIIDDTLPEHVDTCGECGRTVVRCSLASGERVEVDAAPHEDGNLLVVGFEVDGAPTVQRVRPPRPGRLRLMGRYAEHAVVCPTACGRLNLS